MRKVRDVINDVCYTKCRKEMLEDKKCVDCPLYEFWKKVC